MGRTRVQSQLTTAWNTSSRGLTPGGVGGDADHNTETELVVVITTATTS